MLWTGNFNPRAPRGARPVIFGAAFFASIFQSTCPARGTTSILYRLLRPVNLFQSTCPARGTTRAAGAPFAAPVNFNPRAPRGARLSAHTGSQAAGDFNPRAPRGARRQAVTGHVQISKYFNPRAPRGARLHSIPPPPACQLISIHVPREGHDRSLSCFTPHQQQFQSTCPARGTTKPNCGFAMSYMNFNPRAPRGARPRMVQSHVLPLFHFNPRAPRGARLIQACFLLSSQVISIHVPREGHDMPRTRFDKLAAPFQSTCPARGTTQFHGCVFVFISISIHVPREGHDKQSL